MIAKHRVDAVKPAPHAARIQRIALQIVHRPEDAHKVADGFSRTSSRSFLAIPIVKELFAPLTYIHLTGFVARPLDGQSASACTCFCVNRETHDDAVSRARIWNQVLQTTYTLQWQAVV